MADRHSGLSVARGFESKDVEFQQAEAERPRVATAPLSPELRERAARRRTLELARSQAQSELAATVSPIRRQTLADAIADLTREIDAVPVPEGDGR